MSNINSSNQAKLFDKEPRFNLFQRSIWDILSKEIESSLIMKWASLGVVSADSQEVQQLNQDQIKMIEAVQTIDNYIKGDK